MHRPFSLLKSILFSIPFSDSPRRPKTLSRHPQDGPRCLQDEPKTLPRRPQDDPKTAQDAPDAPRKRPSCCKVRFRCPKVSSVLKSSRPCIKPQRSSGRAGGGDPPWGRQSAARLLLGGGAGACWIDSRCLLHPPILPSQILLSPSDICKSYDGGSMTPPFSSPRPPRIPPGPPKKRCQHQNSTKIWIRLGSRLMPKKWPTLP